MLERTVLAIAIALAGVIAAPAEDRALVLPTLPADVQAAIERVRAACPTGSAVTSGDEGLRIFTVSGAQGVLVDELSFCGGGQCLHGVNCATGFSHDVALYVRYGNAWRKSFAVQATEPIFLSVEPYGDKFRAMVVSVHGGDTDCPLRDKNDGAAWKKEKCDFVVKWDDRSKRFTHRPL
jgi:hypothetical protein